MQKDLERAIDAAERYHKAHPGTDVMVVYSDHGGYQGFAEQKNISEEFQVLYRTSASTQGAHCGHLENGDFKIA